MKKLNILCIPPYEGLYRLMSNISAQRDDVNLQVHMGNLSEGVRAVLDNLDGVDCIISRGGTSEQIRQSCDIPVYDAAPTVYDVLRTIRLAQSMGEAFAVIGFRNITKPVKMLAEIMQFDFRICTIRSVEECDGVIAELRESGIRIVVGDMLAVSKANACGMHGLLIVSGIESVQDTITTAVNNHRHSDVITRKASLLSDFLESQTLATVIYAADGSLVYSTGHALPELVGRTMAQCVSEVIAQGSVKITRRSEDSVYTISGRNLNSAGEDYCVYQITQTSNSAFLDKYLIQYVSPGGEMPNCNPIEYFVGMGPEEITLRAACDRYSQMDRPVLVLGERGTGKDQFVHYMYSRSRMKYSSLLVVDASLLEEKGWNFLLNSEGSPLTDTGFSIYFKRLNNASPEHRNQLLLYLKSSPALSANRFYFSFTTRSHSELNRDELYLYLSETLRCLRLEIPPLSRRVPEIPTFVGLYINALNVQHGTHVIGVTHSAMLTLQNYQWTRNHDQLFRTIHDLVLSCKSSYISDEDVNRLLSRGEEIVTSEAGTCFDLNRPLDDIMHDIVLQVYKEENMNQTHTAKRLNISRTTLWRMLK